MAIRILGVDPSLRCSGYGLIDVEGSRMRAVAWGIIKNKPELPISTCLLNIHRELSEKIELWQPNQAAIENMFFFKNPSTAIRLGEARGVVMLALRLQLPEVYGYEPRKVKQSIVGRGSATKPQVQMMVRQLLGLQGEKLPADAADALAVAICHAFAKASPVFRSEPL
ncbi:MAG TPA: crossover junction endodeoxyribonuclease RuvC [Verrucomicrobia bacterium]|jgi:crossover junction endodeoxyribonuclease RuvC|nr:crossover junction endodeoxyribonuclease RuvC [Verrucomicrobiota bacterium]